MAEVGYLLADEPPVACIEVEGKDFCVLGCVPGEPAYTHESVLNVLDLTDGGPDIEEINPA